MTRKRTRKPRPRSAVRAASMPAPATPTSSQSLLGATLDGLRDATQQAFCLGDRAKELANAIFPSGETEGLAGSQTNEPPAGMAYQIQRQMASLQVALQYARTELDRLAAI